MELVNNNKMNEEDGLLVCEVTEKLYNDGYRMVNFIFFKNISNNYLI